MLATEITEMAFNVDDLLNTSSPPSQVQRNYLQNVILQLDEDISDIDEQILVLQTRRTQLLQQRKCYSDPLSPVRCLPIEIFGQIFVYATRDRPRHVLNLSAVCRLWRYAALSTPMLWSTLELGHHTTRRNTDNHINSWIERARSYPLSLVIRKQDGFLDPVKSVLTLITNHRWKSITLDSDDESILPILEKLEFSNLEMLESFSLVPPLNSNLTYPDALRYAPKLKNLRLNIHWHHPVALDMLPFPWRQIISLTITCTFWDRCADALQACVNLEELVIYGGEDVDGSNHFITLNHLRKLHTHCSDNMFLLFLKTPSIQDFAVTNYYSELDIYDYIKKNASTLLKLSIVPYHSRLVVCIPYLRSLVELKLYDDDDAYSNDMPIWMYEILSYLVVRPEMDPSTIPLPRLEALEIICDVTIDIQGLFTKVIDSRSWSDEEENARQKQGQRSLSRIKRSVLTPTERDDVDILRAHAQGMSNSL